MRQAALSSVVLCLVASLAFVACASANETQTENANSGTTAWQLTNDAQNREIEGYASLTSVNVGGSISFFVSTGDSSYTMDFYRIGWYGGAGGREVLGPISLPGGVQPTPVADAYGDFECNWTTGYVLTVPTNWVSGVYLVVLTGSSSGKQAYIQFVVREDSRNSVYLFQRSITTDQAYNTWPGSAYGGQSLYTGAVKVSFNRPYAIDESYSALHDGAGFFPRWEINMVRWLEMNGYDVTYATNIDVHENPNLLLNHKAFLAVAHDEYWSWEMRQNVETARDAGVGLGFFSGNESYWQIRLEPSTINGAADRTQVAYKSLNDPTTDPCRLTILWRQNTCKPSEQAFVGVESTAYGVGGNMVIADPSNWALAGTGLVSGQVISGALGYEVDGVVEADSPAGTDVVAHSPLPSGYPSDSAPAPAYPFSDMATYTAAASGATVFSVGTIQWSWLLDDWGAGTTRSSYLNTPAQQITQNVLARLANSGATAPGDFSVTLAPPSQTSLQGGSGTYTVSVGSSGGFNKSVNLSCTGAPAQSTCTINPAVVTAPSSASVTVAVAGTVAAGAYPFTITGTSGSTTRSQQAQITVGTATATVSPSTSATINVGASTNFTVSLSSTNGASGTVSLGCAGVAAGLSCAFSPVQVSVPASGSVITTLTVAVNAKLAGSSVHDGWPDFRETTGPYYSAAWSFVFTALLLLIAAFVMIHKREDAGPTLTARGLAMLAVVVVLAVSLVSCGGSAGGGNPVTTQFTLQGQSGTATLTLDTMSITVP